MKKILIISRGIPSQKDIMWGNFELDQAKALRLMGHDVVCISIDRRIRFYWRKIGITSKSIGGISLYNFFFPLPYRFLPRKLHDYFVKKFVTILANYVSKTEGAFDVIHAHYLPNIWIATLIKEKWGIPIVGTEHWSEMKRARIKAAVRKYAEESYKKVDKLITVSYSLKARIWKEFGVDSDFVGCVIDDVFEYMPKKADGKFRFIAVGSLFYIKGFDIAIEAFSNANFGSDVEFHIIGEGPQRKKLETLIKSRKLDNRVFLHGRKTRGEIMDYLAKSSAYVLSSRSENFATACMEALSVGLPAIMTKCGGPEDFVDRTNSVLVGVENSQEMAEAMKYMKNNINKYNRKSISDNIKAKYSMESVGRKLDSIYNKVI